MLRLGAQVLLPLDVVALRLIEDEGIAEVGDVAPDGDVVGGNPVGIEHVGDVVGRVEVAGIVHHVLGQPLQHGGVGQRELLDEVAREDGLIDIADVAVRLRDVIVIVGPGEPAAPDEPVEVVIDDPLLAEVGAVFAEAEREDVNLPVAPREQGRQVRAQEESVRSREVDVPSATCVNAVNRLLETLAQLHLVDEEAVACATFISLYNFAMQRVVLEQRLVVEIQKVDVDVVGGRILPRDRGGERLHELGLAGAAHPRDHLYVPGALERPKLLHVRIAVYPSHHSLLIGFETRIILKFRNR